MKKIKEVSIIMLIIFALFSFSSFATLDDYTIAHYKFDEIYFTSGLYDYADNSLHYSIKGNLNSTTGIINNSRVMNDLSGNINYFYRTTSLLNTDGIASFNPSSLVSFSSSVWFKSINNFSDCGSFFYFGGGSSGTLSVNGGCETGKIYIIYTKLGFDARSIQSAVTLNNNTWHLYTFTYLGVLANETRLRIYLDGVLKEENLVYVSATGSGSNLTIGEGLSGIYLDELTFYNKELSQEEITYLYNGGVGVSYPRNDSVSSPYTSVSDIEVADKITDFTTSLGFTSESSKLLLALIVILAIGYFIIKSDIGSQAKSFLFVFISLFAFIVMYYLDYISTPVFVFVAFIVAIVGAIIIRNMFTSSGN